MEQSISAPVLPRRRWSRAFIYLLLLGATLGAALDGIHTHFGATTYPRPVFWQMAWWTPLLFAGAFTIGLLRPLADQRQELRDGQPTSRQHLAGVGFAMTLFVAAYFMSVLPLYWPVVTALISVTFAVSYWFCDRSLVGLGIALTAAVGGPLFEITLVRCGAFVHLQPLYLGVPGWLPVLYLNAAVALTTLARWLVAS